MKKIKKNLIKIVLNVASFLYRDVKYKSQENIVKVNLGCGLRCLPNWINVDGSLTSLFGSKKFIFLNKILYKLAGSSHYFTFNEYNKIITTCDLRFYNLTNTVPLFNNYADVIYHSHFLEHLTKSNGKSFLEDCFRSLKKGGLLRISVPDLDYAFELYKKGEIENMMGLFFFTSDDWDFTAHKYGYNFSHLKEILERIGFHDVKKMSYQKGECPDIDYLDVYPEHSLFVECRK
jgi:predicted SAM-dependent methyltransferase